MARKVYFCFDYEKDLLRANIVCKTWAGKDRVIAGLYDNTVWEPVVKQGDDAVKDFIKKNLEGSTVTVVLIGSKTANLKIVRHQIFGSYKRGSGLLGVYIDNIKDQDGMTDVKGMNPFGFFEHAGISLKNILIYDWVKDEGPKNLNSWIEKAAQLAKR